LPVRRILILRFHTVWKDNKTAAPCQWDAIL